MSEDLRLIEVTNITGSPVVYKVPELNARRTFSRGETKRLSLKELRLLAYLPGGRVLLTDFLSVKDNDFLAELGITVEPEYHWTESDVRDVLLNGTLARLQDCLDYAPVGIINMVKDFAVKLELNDMAKRHAIFQATKFDVTKAIELDKQSKEGTETPDAPVKARRTAAETVPVITTNYKTQ